MNFDQQFFQSIVNILPLPLFIVDDDVRILYANHAGESMIGTPAEKYHLRRGGDILQCMYSTGSPEGCGHAEECGSCIIRSSVIMSIKGQSVTRRRHKMRLIGPNSRKDAYLLITTAPMKYMEQNCAVLIIEDITEIAALQGMVAICAHCRKLRDSDDNWISVESYFEKVTDIDFSHSICPHCFNDIYQKQIEEMHQNRNEVK